MSDPPASMVVIKIKRKRTEAPLTSLFIEESERKTKRIKSGANTPTSASESVNSQPSGSGVFRLAETVREGWVGFGAEGQALHARIAHLQAQPEPVPAPTASSSALPAASQAPAQPRRYQVVKPATASRSGAQGAIGKRSGSGKGKARMDMPIVGGLRRLGGAAARARMMDAPEVVDASKPKIKYPDFRFIDAQAIPSPPSHTPRTKSLLSNTTSLSGSTTDVSASPVPGLDEIGSAFAKSMKVETGPIGDLLPEVTTSKRRPAPSQPKEFVPAPYNHQNQAAAMEEDGEFVYDLYYRDANAVAGKGVGAEDGVAVGALAGFDELLDEEEGGDTSEEYDEADEDSNDEDFYRNDYPEDEDADSDDGAPAEPDRETWTQPHARARDYRYGEGDDSDRDGFSAGEEGDDDEPWEKQSKRARNKVFGLADSDEDDEDEEMERRARKMAEGDDGGEVVGEVEDWVLLTDD